MDQNRGDYLKELKKFLGSKIKDHREERDLTQTELAEKAGISRPTLGKLEKGESASLDKYVEVLLTLDCSLDVSPLLNQHKPKLHWKSEVACKIQIIVREHKWGRNHAARLAKISPTKMKYILDDNLAHSSEKSLWKILTNLEHEAIKLTNSQPVKTCF